MTPGGLSRTHDRKYLYVACSCLRSIWDAKTCYSLCFFLIHEGFLAWYQKSLILFLLFLHLLPLDYYVIFVIIIKHQRDSEICVYVDMQRERKKEGGDYNLFLQPLHISLRCSYDFHLRITDIFLTFMHLAFTLIRVDSMLLSITDWCCCRMIIIPTILQSLFSRYFL